MIEVCKVCGGTGQTFDMDTFSEMDCTICGGVYGAKKKMSEAWKRDIADPHYVDRLREGLRNKGMSQAEFARRCGCSPSRISALLNSKYAEHVPKYIWEQARITLKV